MMLKVILSVIQVLIVVAGASPSLTCDNWLSNSYVAEQGYKCEFKSDCNIVSNFSQAKDICQRTLGNLGNSLCPVWKEDTDCGGGTVDNICCIPWGTDVVTTAPTASPTMSPIPPLGSFKTSGPINYTFLILMGFLVVSLLLVVIAFVVKADHKYKKLKQGR